jgi:hypothetical protein
VLEIALKFTPGLSSSDIAMIKEKAQKKDL